MIMPIPSQSVSFPYSTQRFGTRLPKATALAAGILTTLPLLSSDSFTPQSNGGEKTPAVTATKPPLTTLQQAERAHFSRVNAPAKAALTVLYNAEMAPQTKHLVQHAATGFAPPTKRGDDLSYSSIFRWVKSAMQCEGNGVYQLVFVNEHWPVMKGDNEHLLQAELAKVDNLSMSDESKAQERHKMRQRYIEADLVKVGDIGVPTEIRMRTERFIVDMSDPATKALIEGKHEALPKAGDVVRFHIDPQNFGVSVWLDETGTKRLKLARGNAVVTDDKATDALKLLRGNNHKKEVFARFRLSWNADGNITSLSHQWSGGIPTGYKLDLPKRPRRADRITRRFPIGPTSCVRCHDSDGFHRRTEEQLWTGLKKGQMLLGQETDPSFFTTPMVLVPTAADFNKQLIAQGYTANDAQRLKKAGKPIVLHRGIAQWAKHLKELGYSDTVIDKAVIHVAQPDRFQLPAMAAFLNRDQGDGKRTFSLVSNDGPSPKNPTSRQPAATSLFTHFDPHVVPQQDGEGKAPPPRPPITARQWRRTPFVVPGLFTGDGASDSLSHQSNDQIVFEPGVAWWRWPTIGVHTILAGENMTPPHLQDKK